MSKTGRGRRTNQHQATGASSLRAKGYVGDVQEGSLRDYLSFENTSAPPPNNEYYATQNPSWNTNELLALVADIQPKGVRRAISRYQQKLTEGIFGDSSYT